MDQLVVVAKDLQIKMFGRQRLKKPKKTFKIKNTCKVITKKKNYKKFILVFVTSLVNEFLQ